MFSLKAPRERPQVARPPRCACSDPKCLRDYQLADDGSKYIGAVQWGGGALELNEGPDGPELRVSSDAELCVDGLDVVSTLEDLESRLSTIEGLCVNDTAVEDDGL